MVNPPLFDVLIAAGTCILLPVLRLVADVTYWNRAVHDYNDGNQYGNGNCPGMV